MQMIQALPTDDAPAHHDLIELITRLASEIEDAQDAGEPLDMVLRLRVTYHAAFAELLARTRAADAGAQAGIAAHQAKHERQAVSYRQELAQMTQQGAD